MRPLDYGATKVSVSVLHQLTQRVDIVTYWGCTASTLKTDILTYKGHLTTWYSRDTITTAKINFYYRLIDREAFRVQRVFLCAMSSRRRSIPGSRSEGDNDSVFDYSESRFAGKRCFGRIHLVNYLLSVLVRVLNDGSSVFLLLSMPSFTVYKPMTVVNKLPSHQ